MSKKSAISWSIFRKLDYSAVLLNIANTCSAYQMSQMVDENLIKIALPTMSGAVKF